MPDALKIRETLAVARENLPRLYMASYARGKINPNAATWQEWGVTFCLAGWRCVLDGLRPVADCDSYATMYFINSDGVKYPAWEWAAHSMGLSARESETLFTDTAAITDIDALDWITEQVIAGRNLVPYKACGATGRSNKHQCAHCDGHGLIRVDELLVDGST